MIRSTASAPEGVRSVGGRSSPAAASALLRNRSGNAWSSAVGRSPPQATWIGGASRRSSRLRTTSTPRGQCTSPVPAIVIAAISTFGEATRKEMATRSSGAPSVSTSSRTGPAVGNGEWLASTLEEGLAAGSTDALATGPSDGGTAASLAVGVAGWQDMPTNAHNMNAAARLRTRGSLPRPRPMGRANSGGAADRRRVRSEVSGAAC